MGHAKKEVFPHVMGEDASYIEDGALDHRLLATVTGRVPVRLTRNSNPIDGILSVNLTNKLARRMITTGYINSSHFETPPNTP